MTDLARLVVRLEAETAKYQKELENARKKLSGFHTSTTEILGKIGKTFATLGTVAAVGLGALIKKSIDVADATGKVSQQLGISTEALSRYTYAARINNATNEDLETGLTKLANTAYDAARGNKEAARALEVFGIRGKELKELSLEQMFLRIANEASTWKDSGTKAAAVADVLGKSSKVLIPTLNEGAAGLKRLGEESDRLGNTITSGAAAAADRFNDNLFRLQTAAGGVGRKLAEALLPHLEKLVERFKDPAFQQKIADITTELVKLAGGVIKAAARIGEFVGGLRVLFHIRDLDQLVDLQDELFEKQKQLASIKFDVFGQREVLKEEIALLRQKIALKEKEISDRDNPPKTATPEPSPPPLPTGSPTIVDHDAIDKAKKLLKELQEYAQEVDAKTAASIQNIAIQIAESTGQNIGAVMAKFDADNADLVAHMMQTWDAFGLAQVDRLRTLTAQQAVANELQTKAAEIADSLATKEAEIRLQQDLGAIGATEAIAKVNAAREEERAKLEQIAQLLASIAAMSDDPRIAAAAKKLADSIKQIVPEVTEAQAKMMELRDGFADVFGGFLKNLAHGRDAWKSFLDDMVSMLLRAGIQKLMEKLVGAGQGVGNYGWIGQVAQLFTQRASGGPVAANQPYWVGERGPELMVPDVSGHIIPHGKSMAMAGGGETHVHFHGIVDMDSFKRGTPQIMAKLGSEVRRASARNG